jgi:beta-lactamase superfamily II metal-dependent hydrolase
MLKKFVFITILLIVAVTYFEIKNNPIASWHMINVNYGRLQGEANLLLIGNTSIMIDAGYALEARTEVLPYLNKLGIKKLTISLSLTLIETIMRVWRP